MRFEIGTLNNMHIHLSNSAGAHCSHREAGPTHCLPVPLPVCLLQAKQRREMEIKLSDRGAHQMHAHAAKRSNCFACMARSHCGPIDRWPKVIASVASFPEELVEIVFSAGLTLVIPVRDCVYGSQYASRRCESVHVLTHFRGVWQA